MAVDIDSLQIEIEATSGDAASKIDQLATALTNLKSAAKGGAGLTTTTKQLQALSNAAKLINGTNLNSQKIQQFASAMNSLANIQKASGLSSTINALKKLPDISTELDKVDLGKFAQQMNQVAAAMRPLATEMQKVANGFSAFPIRIQKIIQSNSALTASNSKAAKSFGVLGTGISSAQAKFGVYLIAFRQIASVMSDWVKESNDYVENLNLFTVAMGDYAAEAKVYAEEVQAAMGIDPSEWMRNQGVFMQMASGFGVATDSAALMSKNLTQLGYDISSFYNIGIEEAMEKLQSGLAGEIEPLRRLGYAIDQASLEQVALNHGITESVNSMTQAEKAQLRYVAIMEQSTNAMGDLSRTIQTPANAMRILNQQIIQLRRALGNMLIPILQQVIPWVQAFVEVLTEAAQAIANLLGFELPTIDYSGLEGVSAGASDASDALGEAADAAKKLQHYTIGIDELNIISPQQNAAADTGVGAAGGDLGLELPEYDFLNGLTSQTEEYKKKLEDLLKVVLAVGAAFAAWKIATGLASGLLGIKTGVDTISKALALLMGFAPIKALLNGIAGALAAMTLQFYAAGGGISGFLAVAKLIGTTIGPAVAVFFVLASVLKVLVERWDDIKKALSDIFEKLNISERLGVLQKNLDDLGLKLGWVNGFWEGLKSTIGALMDFVGGVVITVFGSSLIGVLNALIDVLNGLITIVNGVIDVLSGVRDFIVGVFTGDLTLAVQGINLIGQGIQEVFGGLWQAVVGGVMQFVNGVLNAFSSLGGTLLNENIPNILNGIIGFWGDVVSFFTEAVPNWWNETIAPWFTVEKWAELGKQAIDGLFSGLSNIWGTVSSWGENLLNDVKDVLGIHSPSVEFEVIGEYSVAGLKNGFNQIPAITELFIEQIAIMKQNAQLFSSDVYNMIDTTLEFLLESLATAQTEQQRFTDAVSLMYRNMATSSNAAIQSIISYLNSIPREITTVHTIITRNVGGGSSKSYASGGFPDTGQMFIAREAGPELVGTIGKRTAVANNAQIVAGISAGVEEANQSQNALLREQNELLRAILAKEGTVNISNKTIKRAYDSASRQSGVSIMPGGVMG